MATVIKITADDTAVPLKETVISLTNQQKSALRAFIDSQTTPAVPSPLPIYNGVRDFITKAVLNVINTAITNSPNPPNAVATKFTAKEAAKVDYLAAIAAAVVPVPGGLDD